MTNVELPLSCCPLTLTRTVTAFALKTNAAGVVVGFEPASSNTLTSSVGLCGRECLSDSIPEQPTALLTIPEDACNEMLAGGGEVVWTTA